MGLPVFVIGGPNGDGRLASAAGAAKGDCGGAAGAAKGEGAAFAKGLAMPLKYHNRQGYCTVKKVFLKFFAKVFEVFARIFEVFASFSRLSDAFGPIRTHSEAFGSV